jgi:hypothetical protein
MVETYITKSICICSDLDYLEQGVLSLALVDMDSIGFAKVVL